MAKCKHGHVRTPDNEYIDRRGYRLCRVCMRAWHKVYRDRNRPAEPVHISGRYAAAPIVRALKRYAVIHEEAVAGGYSNGTSLLARKYCTRYGGNPATVQGRLHKLYNAEYVSAEFADELAILIGLHPVLIWGAEWFQWDAA